MSRIVTHQLIDAQTNEILVRVTMTSTEFWSPIDLIEGRHFNAHDALIQTSSGGAGDAWVWHPAVVVLQNGRFYVTTEDAFKKGDTR